MPVLPHVLAALTVGPAATLRPRFWAGDRVLATLTATQRAPGKTAIDPPTPYPINDVTMIWFPPPNADGTAAPTITSAAELSSVGVWQSQLTPAAQAPGLWSVVAYDAARFALDRAQFEIALSGAPSVPVTPETVVFVHDGVALLAAGSLVIDSDPEAAP